jgi:glucosamine--fructose-6-phosphate aminotransferase (isomerizing)
MCNIAGYIGSERAAPILLELIERQEGLAGGFYTGIATIHKGKLHWRKVVGDCARLIEETDAADLPGTIGLAHSRSNSGGDWRWSHPFVACDDTLAYIANGSMGYFEGRTDTTAAAQRLDAGGHELTAVADEQIGSYPSLFDGGSVHVSDVMAHLIEWHLDEGRDPEAAIREAFLEFPAEIVGLFIAPAHPDSIFAARYTMPMCVAIEDTGARIASSPTGFGAHPDWWNWVPPFSIATVSADGLVVSPLQSPYGPLTSDISVHAARERILAVLNESGPTGAGPLISEVKGLSGREHLVVACDPTYEALFELLTEGYIEQETVRREGAVDGVPAPQFRFVPTPN